MPCGIGCARWCNDIAKQAAVAVETGPHVCRFESVRDALGKGLPIVQEQLIALDIVPMSARTLNVPL